MNSYKARNGHDSDRLSGTLEEARRRWGLSLGDLTVLSRRIDPFRVDTPSRHRDGAWLAREAERLGLGERIIHLRGLHYMLVSGESVKPDGKPYTNTDSDWKWLVDDAAKAARWLGYIPFEQIRDARNSEPVIRRFFPAVPYPYINIGLDVEIPHFDDLKPTVGASGFTGTQPNKLVLFGEKTSLEDVIAPIAEELKADLYLMAGEISDSLLYTIASVGDEDGRPLIVLTLSDSDPAGWQMPISIGRKLQAFRAVEFPNLEFQVHRVALRPDQVREYGLPVSPLKETERRAEDWRRGMGVEQTEIDALAALQPDLLDRLVRQACTPFYDASLDRRVRRARSDGEAEAQARLDEQLDQEQLDRIREEAAWRLAELQEEIEALRESLRVDVDEIELPEIVIPGPMIDVAPPPPLIDSSWGWTQQTVALKKSKSY